MDWEHAFDGTPGCKVMMMMDTRVQGGDDDDGHQGARWQIISHKDTK